MPASIPSCREGVGSERLLWARLNSRHVLAGTPDWVRPVRDGVEIWDYKTVGTTPAAPYDSHIRQLAAYGFLLRENGCEAPLQGVLTYLTANDGLSGFRFP